MITPIKIYYHRLKSEAKWELSKALSGQSWRLQISPIALSIEWYSCWNHPRRQVESSITERLFVHNLNEPGVSLLGDSLMENRVTWTWLERAENALERAQECCWRVQQTIKLSPTGRSCNNSIEDSAILKRKLTPAMYPQISQFFAPFSTPSTTVTRQPLMSLPDSIGRVIVGK